MTLLERLRERPLHVNGEGMVKVHVTDELKPLLAVAGAAKHLRDAISGDYMPTRQGMLYRDLDAALLPLTTEDTPDA